MRKHISNTQIFLDENDFSFYLLGAYMTDGNVSIKSKNKNFSISSKDEDWIEQIRDLICPTRKVRKKDNNHFVLKSFDLKVIDWLVSYGCEPRKSLTLEMKKEIPQEYMKDFIRGIVDGDGSISTSRYNKIKKGKTYTYTKINTYICSASQKFINKLYDILTPQFKCSLIEIKPGDIHKIRGKIIESKNTMWRIHFNDSNAKKFLNWCYSDASIAMPRKAKLAAEILAG